MRQQPASPGGTNSEPDVDVIIIGAGMAGLYQLYRVRELGMSVRVIEAGSDLGGTWFWNRYPGARLDSESYSYAYSFSRELLEQWEWTEHFAAQPETLRYVNFVADKFDLRRDITFNRKVVAAHWQEDKGIWLLSIDNGEQMSARFLITAIGNLSVPSLPRLAGMDRFKGFSCHTAEWPHEPVRFEGKRVAVIGTGPTGIQVIQEVAKTARSLTVFQRTGNWSAPLNNSTITEAQNRALRASFQDIFQRCMESNQGFLHKPDPRRATELGAAEREAFWEKRYGEPGFAIWMGNFRDVLVDREANALMSEFVARKVHQRVRDPAVAARLIPKNHGFGVRRLPLETNYLEVYNQDNVELVDLLETPIECVTAHGIKTTDRDFEFDMIIYATGFDALTGAFDRIDFRGKGGKRLKELWTPGARTFLGALNAGFPNLLMLLGPMGALGNFPRSIEYGADWLSNLLRHMRDGGHTRVEARPESVDAWMDVVGASSKGLLATEVDSWTTGVNTNVAGKDKRVQALYTGTGPAFRARSDAVAAGGYRELDLR